MECSFCGKNVLKGTGFIFVRKTGQVLNFCSRKCETNMVKLKRQPRKTRWTKEYAKTKAANIAQRQHEKDKKTDVKA